jgi:hypothetical protein
VKRVSKGKKSSKLGRDEKGAGGRSEASGERTSRGCDEGWDGGRLLMDRLRFDGVVVVPLVLLGVSRVKMLAIILRCCGNRREGSACKKKRVELCGRRTRWKESRKERD